jgi:hypothetical protein
VGIAEVLDMHIGQSERYLAEVFAQARRKASCTSASRRAPTPGSSRKWNRSAVRRLNPHDAQLRDYLAESLT